MMNIQELATIRRYRLPLKILLIDNSQLGMVRQWQELFFAENFSEIDLSDNPDFAEVARAFGIEAFTIDYRSEVPAAIERLLEHRRTDPLPRPHRSARECLAAGAAEQVEHRDDGEGPDDHAAPRRRIHAPRRAPLCACSARRAARLHRPPHGHGRVPCGRRATLALTVEPRDAGRSVGDARAPARPPRTASAGSTTNHLHTGNAA